jgi:ATP-dependent DNA ligase
VLPAHNSRLLYVDHVRRRGIDLFREMCARDCEGIVAKWKHGTYRNDGVQTSWLKVRNPEYSPMRGRRELFEQRRDRRQTHRRDYRKPELHLR